jgi:bifunctional non-homologous end joining protein LigD
VTADEMREMQWVVPEFVAQIRFVGWTAEGRLRHAAFLGLRSDKRSASRNVSKTERRTYILASTCARIRSRRAAAHPQGSRFPVRQVAARTAP